MVALLRRAGRDGGSRRRCGLGGLGFRCWHGPNVVRPAGVGNGCGLACGSCVSLPGRPRKSVCGHRCERWECVVAEQCHNVPSPLVGEGQGEGWPRSTERNARRAELRNDNGLNLSNVLRRECRACRTPLPVPPPQGGREPCGARLRNSDNESVDDHSEMVWAAASAGANGDGSAYYRAGCSASLALGSLGASQNRAGRSNRKVTWITRAKIGRASCRERV